MPQRAVADLSSRFRFPRNDDQSQTAFPAVGKNRTALFLVLTETDVLSMPERTLVNFGFRGEIPLHKDQGQTARMAVYESDTCLVFHRGTS